jgi:hypothetical protein
MNAIRLTIIPVALAFSACAMLPRYTSVYYGSSPAGAEVVQGGEVIGRTPLRKQYRISDAGVTPGACVQVDPVVIQWPSGAQQSVDPGTACWNQMVLLRVERPAGVPGIEKDLAARRVLTPVTPMQYGPVIFPLSDGGSRAMNANAPPYHDFFPREPPMMGPPTEH